MRPRVANRTNPRFELANSVHFKYHKQSMSLTITTVIVRFLEGLFVAGSVGSFVVLVLTGIEDLKMLLGREEENNS